jgi:glycosyltransferase involved in cell wall biosynthesis
MWYLEAYCAHRRPLRAPFSAEQVRWMLEPEAAYISPRPLARIVEAFWRRSFSQVNPYQDDRQYLLTAYWWVTDIALPFGVEHFLVPDDFIAALKRPVPGPPARYPLNEFLREFVSHRQELPWALSSDLERLAAYIRILSEPEGIYFSLFFPDEVIKALATLPEMADDHKSDKFLGISAYDISQVSARAEAASRFIRRHRELRRGQRDISAPLLDRDWTKLMKVPARSGAHNPRVLDGLNSALNSTLRVIGPINSQSGLGQATRMSISSLLEVGISPQGFDFYLDNPAPRREAFSEGAVVKSPSNINIIHLSGESVPLVAAYLQSEMFDGAYNIGYFFWELPRAAVCQYLALDLLDEVWVSSEFNAETYRSITNIPVVKVGMSVETLPPGISLDHASMRRKYGLPETSFVFMASFDSYSFISRKNPSAVLRSFLAAFGHSDADVRLVIKTHNLTALLGEATGAKLVRQIQDLVALDDRIVLIDETLPFEQLLALKAACDCYVSLHRSEGWGFGIVEAMQLGLPVIATAFSGNLEFCTAETAYNVGYKLVYLQPDEYIFVQAGDQWAEPNETEAASFMEFVVGNPAAAKEMGRAAKAYVEANFSKNKIGHSYADRLKEIESCRLS